MIARSRAIRVTPQINRQSPQALGLVSAWPLNNGGGLVARDAVGQNHGTLMNGPTWGMGPLGSALSFDGVNDYVEADGIEPQHFTLSVFLFVDGLPSHNDSYGGWVIANSSQIPVQYCIGYSPTNNNIFAFISSSEASISTPNGSILQGKPYHVALTYNQSTQSIYINGILSASSARTVTLVYPTSGNRIQIGRWGYIGYTRNFNGKLSDVRLYNRALSAAEVQRIYLRSKDLYAPPRSLLYAATIEEALNLWPGGPRARQVWVGGHRAQQIWTGGHRIL